MTSACSWSINRDATALRRVEISKIDNLREPREKESPIGHHARRCTSCEWVGESPLLESITKGFRGAASQLIILNHSAETSPQQESADKPLALRGLALRRLALRRPIILPGSTNILGVHHPRNSQHGYRYVHRKSLE